jgi:Kdo2-lipid IVA lauroyltransferase/acyltransferase
MHLILYILVYPILWLISKLPFRVLYFLSDIIGFITYYILGYRKSIVRENINLTLPHLSEKDRLQVEKKFYSHLCDMFLEMVKTLSITDKQIGERFKFRNIEVVNDLEKQNKSIILITGHYASYEWMISINKFITNEGFAIYKKLANPYFDKLVKKIRSKFKATLITTKETIPTIEENFKNNKHGVYGFASDQSPKMGSVYHWNTFLGIEVPLHTSAEMLAKKFDISVVYLNVTKVKRGFYEADFELITDNPKSIPDYQITDAFFKLLEKQILKAPEFYLWTHKRWKHRR